MLHLALGAGRIGKNRMKHDPVYVPGDLVGTP